MTPVSLRDAKAAIRKARPNATLNINPHQGEREKRRRRKQMTLGQLHADLPETVQPVDPLPDGFLFP